MAQDPADAENGGWTLKWETVVAVVGAAAALGLWINVVGGAVLWTRFVEADVPATHIVGLVPNTTLIGVGLRALALPLLVASVAVGVFYVVRREPTSVPPAPPRPALVPRQRFRDVLAALLILAAVRRLPRRPSPPPAPPAPGGPSKGMPGFGIVLLLLVLLAAVAVFARFGGEVHLPTDKEYVYAWALASPFLVVGAATYEPFAQWVRSLRWPKPRWTYGWIAVVGFAVIVGLGIWAHRFWAAFWVALLSPVAAFLACRLRPGARWGMAAGGWLVTFYIGLGITLFLVTDGRLELHPAGYEAAILLAALMTSVALLFLHVVGKRSSNMHLVAAVMFAVVAVWGGGINYLQERFTTPTFELTAMLRTPQDGVERAPVSGFLIAAAVTRSSSRRTLARSRGPNALSLCRKTMWT